MKIYKFLLKFLSLLNFCKHCQYKVWSLEQDQGHGTKDNVWTRIDFELPQGKREIYILCHVHGGDNKFTCHYSKFGEGEPSFQL